MKRPKETNNEKLSIIFSIIFIICIIELIVDVGIVIENIVWFNDYSPALIFLASFAIACAIYVIINEIKMDKRIKKRRDEFNKKKGNN